MERDSFKIVATGNSHSDQLAVQILSGNSCESHRQNRAGRYAIL